MTRACYQQVSLSETPREQRDTHTKEQRDTQALANILHH
jgi:hypothetical protein